MKWTEEETAAADKAIDQLKRTVHRLDDLLTDEERASLNADLAEMVRIRRRAQASSSNLEMP